jgi:hypothetical protein
MSTYVFYAQLGPAKIREDVAFDTSGMSPAEIRERVHRAYRVWRGDKTGGGWWPKAAMTSRGFATSVSPDSVSPDRRAYLN